METQSTERLHSLDAVRAIALLLGIVLHGTMSFLPELKGVGWPIIDTQQTGVLSIVFYAIHIFRMATFFIIAGFFAHLVFHRRGFKGFVKDRSKRILVPMLSLWLPIVIAVLGVFTWVFVKTTGSLQPPTESSQQQAFPLMHFWFLYILTWLYIMALLVRSLIAKLDPTQRLRTFIDTLFGALMRSNIAPLVFALPVVALLYCVPNWGWWAGIPTPDQSLVPVWPSLFIYFYVFGLGWVLDRQRELLAVLHQRWAVNLLLGIVAATLCFFVGRSGPETLGSDVIIQKILVAALYGFAIIANSFAFIGIGMQFFSKENATMRYVADASYWMYVWHLPVVLAWQVVFMNVDLHWLIKFLLIQALTCIPLLLTYSWFVRSTWIGAIMNGRRYPRGLPTRLSMLPAH